MEKKTTYLIGGACALCIAVAAFVATRSTAPVEDSEPAAQTAQGGKTIGKKTFGRKGATATRVVSDAGVRVKPNFALAGEDEEHLTAEQKKLIDDIRLALEEERVRDLIALIKKLQRSPEFPDGIPMAIKTAAIDALAYFGNQAFPAMIGFMADKDPEVLEMAMDAFDEALQDANGDAELSTMLIAACQVVSDPDQLESFLMELDEMRHSVAVKTIKEIYKTGTQAAKDALQEAIDSYTCEEGITLDKLDQWLQEHPDDPDDNDLFGPTTEGDDPDTPEEEEEDPDAAAETTQDTSTNPTT